MTFSDIKNISNIQKGNFFQTVDGFFFVTEVNDSKVKFKAVREKTSDEILKAGTFTLSKQDFINFVVNNSFSDTANRFPYEIHELYSGTDEQGNPYFDWNLVAGFPQFNYAKNYLERLRVKNSGRIFDLSFNGKPIPDADEMMGDD